MSFNDNVQLDTSSIGSGGVGGGGRGGLVVGGGIGGLILAIIIMLLGGNPGSLGGDQTGSDPNAQNVDSSAIQQQCKTGADANKYAECRIVGTVNSAKSFWSDELPRYGKQFREPGTIIYSGATQSACGTASNQVGPFYCPLDEKIYIDASFFDLLTQRFGADDGALAQEYVVAHEYGHHIQNILGLLGRAQQDPQGETSGAVRIELMADCFAGMWAGHASSTKDATGTTYLKPLTETDIRSALSAASAVGDDQIQEKTQGRVTPESWTHGSAEGRQRWFIQGMKAGDDINKCNTFNVNDPNTQVVS
ncbi:MAG TPA: neutral zinc metallopeptidase [Tetrasphaera sp.]|uniref:KPN_02809 family neutral zinc metallopeptidase n=1 Tax=Nostocoides sp. TaxID=1917966 RepID=UPI002D18032B|nr:neutral zinc metallopeptidase [Tetrasphaera sp.]HNQ05689.1 neutral zinc metallopeptidase [Tetrasphaera sp.]